MGNLAVTERIRSSRSFSASLLGSIVLHGSIVFAIHSFFALPDFSDAFQEPTEIEFGIVGGREESANVAPRTEPTTTPSGAPTGTGGSESTSVDAGVRRPRDAGVFDAGVDASLDASLSDAGDGGDAVRRPTVARATDSRNARLPSGGNVALRFDFERIRTTQLSGSISQLLGTIRDFQAIIGGSGLDPVNDLDQFVMASRNPWHRNLYMYLGRLRHDESWARERVAALAANRGAVAEWTVIEGYEAAPWHDADADVDRMLVLLGNRYFILAPSDQVPTALAWLASMSDGTTGDHAGEAMALGVARDEIISLEAENVPRYMRPDLRPTSPTRFRLSIVANEQQYDFAVRSEFEDPDRALAGAALLDDTLSENRRAAELLGLDAIVDSVQVNAEGDLLRGRSVLAERDVRFLVDAAKGILETYYEEHPDGPGTNQ